MAETDECLIWSICIQMKVYICASECVLAKYILFSNAKLPATSATAKLMQSTGYTKSTQQSSRL
ncbi:hypothetical protein HanRHA438_Chr01g0003871 [Helianthus annuus]|nr:hypothetical protein HanRHA438_Chr01g0003871 [Helianthus annuus]